MKTVPTLCATATVVGASAVGLSFGRETPYDSSSQPNKRRTSPAQEPCHDSMTTAVQTTAKTSIAPPFSAPIPVTGTTRAPFSSRSSQDGRSQRRFLRRTISDDAALQPGTALHSYAPSDQDITESESSGRGPTRRPSWMKRISTISNSSRNPSPSPLSPALSYSNGSMTLPQDCSVTTVTTRRPKSQLPPNKLVKRSSSVHGPRELHDQGPASLRPSFRRPATSHQRSKTLQQHAALLEMTVEDQTIENQAHSTSTDSEAGYTQFFKSKIMKERILSKRRELLANVTGFRRVLPDEKHTPTLVLARAISTDAEETEESMSDEGESSILMVSRPGTPLSFTAMFASKRESSQSRPASRVDHHDHASPPRRSFSITDLFSSASGARKRRTSKEPGARLPRRAISQRVSSAPLLPTMSKRPISASFAEIRSEPAVPFPAKRDIATASGAEAAYLGNGCPEDPSSLLPALTVRRVDGVPEVMGSAAASPNHMPPSPTLAQSGVRPSRHSMAPSEQASTLVGSSDNEIRALGSGDEDDADFQSETVFDSLRTGATRSTSGGARGPRIETIFDESPPSKPKVTALRDLLPPGAFGEYTTNGTANQHSIAEEEESIATPVRTVRGQCSLQDSPSYTRAGGNLFPNSISSSPPSMPKPLSLGTLEWDARAGDDDDSSRWSLDDDDVQDPWIDFPAASHTVTPVSLLQQNPRLFASGSSSKPTTPLHLTADHGDREARSSIFDWSEQQVADKKSGNRSPPRPRTVHGKKDADRRGSRSVGRRVSSGLHARSQSVPVVPDATGKRSTVVTNKFGTWGVGSKGVTEDWNDDFDFSELAEEPSEDGSIISPRIDSGAAMIVPKSIQEQQNNVLANIGLLREWGLLIEELKEHRVRAVTLGITEGPHASMWEEVDAMIDLADQEAEHDGVAGMSPPSSPAFDEDAFDDIPPVSPSHGRGRRKSSSPKDEFALEATPSASAKRKSILPPNHQIFAPQSSPIPPKPQYKAHQKHDSAPIITRPRKDSEAKARSVIEALQNKRRSLHDPVPDAPPTPSSKKVPFDTATLRRIVPYVNTLTRKVKDSIRDAEGLYSSPHTSPQNEEPSFSKIFQQDADLAKQMKLMTVM